MTVLAVAMTKFKVGDLAGLEKFYTETLGFAVVARIDEGEGEGELHELILALPGQQPQFALIQYPNLPVPQPGEAVVILAVSDLEATIADVVSAGGRSLSQIYDLPQYDLKMAYVADPEGHTLELTQKLSA